MCKTLCIALAAMLIAGCAGKNVNMDEDTPATAKAPVPVIDPSTPEGVLALAKRLVGDRLTVYQASRSRYTNYVNGAVLAEYDPDTGILYVSEGAREPRPPVCKYGPDGALFVDAGEKGDVKAGAKVCAGLIERLNSELGG